MTPNMKEIHSLILIPLLPSLLLPILSSKPTSPNIYFSQHRKGSTCHCNIQNKSYFENGWLWSYQQRNKRFQLLSVKVSLSQSRKTWTISYVVDVGGRSCLGEPIEIKTRKRLYSLLIFKVVLYRQWCLSNIDLKALSHRLPVVLTAFLGQSKRLRLFAPIYGLKARASRRLCDLLKVIQTTSIKCIVKIFSSLRLCCHFEQRIGFSDFP